MEQTVLNVPGAETAPAASPAAVPPSAPAPWPPERRADAPSEAGGVNRRSSPRLPDPPLFVSGLWATVADVSEGGMCLQIRDPVQPGERYELILTNGIFPYTLECEVEVIWVRRGKAGVRFVDVTAQQEIWLRDRFREWQKDRQHVLHVLKRPGT